MSIFSRKECLYNKALATTLEGSRKFLGGTSARLGCDETGRSTKFGDILEKYRRGDFANGLGSKSHGLILWENNATGLRIIFKLDCWILGFLIQNHAH